MKCLSKTSSRVADELRASAELWSKLYFWSTGNTPNSKRLYKRRQFRSLWLISGFVCLKVSKRLKPIHEKEFNESKSLKYIYKCSDTAKSEWRSVGGMCRRGGLLIEKERDGAQRWHNWDSKRLRDTHKQVVDQLRWCLKLAMLTRS